MQIARPVNGFKLVERPAVQITLNDSAHHLPWLTRAYENVVARLKMAGHKVGYPVSEKLTNRVFVEADPETDQNRFAVSYKVLGDTLTILAIKVLID